MPRLSGVSSSVLINIREAPPGGTAFSGGATPATLARTGIGQTLAPTCRAATKVRTIIVLCPTPNTELVTATPEIAAAVPLTTSAGSYQ